jgi:hypothetical protein
MRNEFAQAFDRSSRVNPNLPSSAIRIIACGVLGALVLFRFTACHTAPVTEPYKTVGWENHRLPNAAEPYDKLLVEIDAVAGTAPGADELAELKTFLEQVTNKQGGVTLKVDNLIPNTVARGRGPDSLALEFLNGPADERTAFIYILCYRSGLGRLFAKADQPNFTFFPYPCAIFIDRSYGAFNFWFYHAPLQRVFLRHEIGHALGLARNPTHTNRGHCTNEGCFMRAAINFNFRRLLAFRPPLDNTELCADCRHDLELFKTAEPPSNARLWHGYFLRAGEGYQILTLPGFVYVHFGELVELTPEKITEARRNAVASVTGRANSNINATFTLPDAAAAIARFVDRETEQDALHQVAQAIFENCIAQAEAVQETNREQAREIVSETLIGAAAIFPELQTRMKGLHAKLAEAAITPASEAPGALDDATP